MDLTQAIRYINILNNTTSNYLEYLEIEQYILFRSVEAFNEIVLFKDGSMIEVNEGCTYVYENKELKSIVKDIIEWQREARNLLNYGLKKTKLQSRLPSFTFFSSPKKDIISFKNQNYLFIIESDKLNINGFIRIVT